jgi:Na+-transporting methylmalonyl-CoA/oxaloacetate decarboxylase gamma subunit
MFQIILFLIDYIVILFLMSSVADSSMKCKIQKTNKHNCAHLPSKHPVANSNEDFEELAQRTSQLIAQTHEL